MAEYVSKETLLKAVEKMDRLDKESTPYEYDKDGYISLIKNAPTADVAEAKHGEWIRHEPNPEKMKEFHKKGIGLKMSETSIFYTCSCCGNWGTLTQKYCPECGAKMDGGNEE